MVRFLLAIAIAILGNIAVEVFDVAVGINAALEEFPHWYQYVHDGAFAIMGALIAMLALDR